METGSMNIGVSGTGISEGSIVAVAVTNVLAKIPFVAAMCYCLHMGHFKFAVACLVAALLSGMSINTDTKDKKSKEEH